ncbi:retrovirus-related pol polyprotein from transposon TNT 1-94 [Tanacetum coccineum]
MGMKGLAECKASTSNLRRIQVKDIVKEVKDYLKTYSLAEMDISCWKVRFLMFLDGLEPYLLKTLEDGPFVHLSNLSTPTNPLLKPQNHWTHAEARLANQDKRLKSIIISCLPNNVIKAVIKCKTTKAMWNDLILAHEGPSDTRDTKIDALRLKFNAFKTLEGEKVNGTFTRLKCLLNDLENNGAIISQAEDSNLDVEEDIRSSSDFIADLNIEYHERALLANQKRFYKRSGRVGSARKPMDKSNEICFACGKKGHFQKECLSNKTSTQSYPHSNKSSTPSYPPSTKSYNKPKTLTHTSSQNSDNHQKVYKGKYKGLKAEIVVLTKKIDAMSKGKSEKGLVAESFDWDEESVSLEDEGTTKIKSFMAIAKEEPSVGKADARSGQWVEITMKKGKRKEKISSKEVIFTKAGESSSMPIPEITSDSESECETREPLPPLPKLVGVAPAGTSNSLISLADLTLNMADLTLNTSVPKKTKPTSDKVSPAYAITKKTETNSPVVPVPQPEKKVDLSAEQLLLTLMDEVKSLKEQIKVPSENSPSYEKKIA